VPARTLVELQETERELSSATALVSSLTFSVASSRETASPTGYVHPSCARPRVSRLAPGESSPRESAQLNCLRPAAPRNFRSCRGECRLKTLQGLPSGERRARRSVPYVVEER
jgi:hypothetical protein